jgi:malic enzyme
VSKGNLLKAEDIQHMATDPVIFALANPTPEIMPDVAKAAGAFIVATGRSDFPNQVNNVLAFPGIFRGALDARLPQITEEHKIAAAQALAAYIAEPDVDHILPSALDKGVANVIANAISHLPSIQSQISLFPYNTLRIDVQAKYFVEIRTEEELQALFASKIFHQEKRIIL